MDSKATPVADPLTPEPESKAKRDLRELATKVDHLSTHLPKNPYCLACQESKMKQKYTHRGAFQRDLSSWGDIVTCDHLVSPSLKMQGLGGEKYGLSVKDLHSGMIAVYPVTEKDTASTIAALRHFAGRRNIHISYSDNALELAASARSMGIEHHTSLHGEPKTNSIIERTNQIIVGGTTASLIAAGLPPCYWSYATQRFCANYNAQGLVDT